MSSLTFTTKKLKGSPLRPQDAFPIMRKQLMFEKEALLDEEDGLFINYGKMMNMLPYQYQSSYGSELEDMEFDSAILENEYLKAEFIPDLGGRLWSLFDKKENQDIVTNNPIFRPRNFALRNAWFSGGVEWNMGVRGHSPLTCEKLYMATLNMPDGTPVLRFYQFERARALTYQMDFFLPADSKYLLCRMRILNNQSVVVPAYWWSTIAVDQQEGSRIVVPADETYINQGFDPVYKDSYPYRGGVDCSYPTNHKVCIDYFYNIPEQSRKYIANLDKEGYGVVQVSTDRLAGRKLFIWGDSPGGNNWQSSLTSKEGNFYAEIQAGLAKTQNECLPMPPNTAWEWMEAYGAIKLDKEIAHGKWEKAKDGVESFLEQTLPRPSFEHLLRETKNTVALVSGEAKNCAGGWITLENILRKKQNRKPLPNHLYYTALDEAEEYWNHLLSFGSLGERKPEEGIPSFMVQDEWFALLKEAALGPDACNWQTHYHLGVCYYFREDMERALDAFEFSLSLASSPWAMHGLANTYRAFGQPTKAATCFAKACAMKPDDEGLFKEALRTIIESEEYDLALSTYHIYKGKPAGLIDFFKIYAMAHTGLLDEALELLLGNLDIPDYREGDDSITDLYLYIISEKAKLEGKNISPEKIDIPQQIDFRMFNKNVK